jgi:hypothetical protein
MAVKGSVSLGRAVRDERLLGAAISWWPAQLAIFDAIEKHRTTVISVGRQSGKSSIAAATAVWDATCRPVLDGLMSPGRVRFQLIGCPGESQAKEVVELCEALAEASPALRGLFTVTATRIDFRIPRTRPDGSTFEARTAIRALPANSRTIRGLSASLILLDEFAHFSDGGGPGSDDRMWTALLPSTRMFGAAGSHVVACSTPEGTSGKFYELFQAAEGGAAPSSVAIRMATADVVPDVDPEWLEAQRVELGDALFDQEYRAEFVSGAGSFFDLDGLEFDAGPTPPGDPRISWTACLDPAFHGDKFGVALIGEHSFRPGEFVLGAVAALEPVGVALSFDARRAREDATLAAVWELIAPYKPGRVVTDQHQSTAIESYFGRLGCRVETVNLNGPTQTAAFVSLRSRLVDGSLRLWRHEQLIEDLRRVRARDTETIFLPRFAGSHCDTASALAVGAWWLSQRPGAGRPAVAIPTLVPVMYGGGWDCPLDRPNW